MPRLEPGHRVDRFEVVGLLGEGGMAAVWEVLHVDLRTHHALKVLQIVAPGLQERLVEEGRIQARLVHPNVCRVTDVVRMGEVLGLVMELVRGPSLDGLLASYQPNVLQADHLARGIVAGVRAAHAAGLVHRDLKPANVLIEVGADGVAPKVTDFGLAKAVDEAVTGGRADTRSGVTMGTPCYMAPEQYRDAKRADKRSDLFSIGCILYEIVSGMKPFDGPTPLDIYQRTSTGAFRPLSEVAPNVPERMAHAVARALRPDPAERFADCAELLAAWCGEVEDEELASCWEPSHLQLLASLGDHGPVDRSTVSIAVGPPPEIRSPTAVPDQDAAEPTSEGNDPVPVPTVAERPPGPRTLLTVAGTTAAAAVVSATVGLVALGGFVLSGGFASSRAEVRDAVRDEVRDDVLPPIRLEVEPEVPPAAAPAAGTPADAPAAREEMPAAVPVPAPTGEPRQVRPRDLGTAGAAPVPALPEPPAPGPDQATVTSRNGLELRLTPVGGGRAVAAGPIAPGRYDLHVFFHPAQPTRVLEISVAGGDRVDVACNSQLRVCRCEPASACR